MTKVSVELRKASRAICAETTDGNKVDVSRLFERFDQAAPATTKSPCYSWSLISKRLGPVELLAQSFITVSVKMALDSFFHNKIESMKLEIIQGQAVLRRLEAQRNDYNSRGAKVKGVTCTGQHR